MSGLAGRAGRRLLFALEPERAHGLSLRALRSGLVRVRLPRPDPRLRCRVAGLSLDSPLGLAAGYDKNGEAVAALLRLGFGFVEIGTVTPRPQAGNARPRIFRLVRDAAVINRLGFNNAGHAAAHARLSKARGAGAQDGIIGVNIGANKDSADRVADYVAGIEAFCSTASYFTVNISSPNTPGLRDLQGRTALVRLLDAVLKARGRQAGPDGSGPPIFVKIAPDLGEADLDDIAEAVLAAGVDGLIVSNTTLSRSGLTDRRQAGEAGGLSGRPLFERATIVLAKMRHRLGPEVALIGVGGVANAADAAEKIRAGADLVQLYTGLVYGGPGLPAAILAGLSTLCEREGLATIGALRDRRTAEWAARPIPPA